MSVLPSVTAIMIADGRPEMVRRAVDSFLAQTYPNKALLILGDGFDKYDGDEGVDVWPVSQFTESSLSIGRLRNLANGLTELPNVICHWDSDDWSHPNRIAEQVALLQSSGAECVGYNEMLFWREARIATEEAPLSGAWKTARIATEQGESWLYRSTMPNYAIGTSMCYWRDTWRKHPFPDRSEGCDDLYWSTGNRVKIVSMTSVPMPIETAVRLAFPQGPRMIASIHGGNTCAKIQPGAKEWTPAPEWDDYCRSVMKKNMAKPRPEAYCSVGNCLYKRGHSGHHSFEETTLE